MRIRKRKVPLPISLLSPVPLSDPHLFSRSPVILVQGDHHDITTGNDSQHLTSDPHRLIDDDAAVGCCLGFGRVEAVPNSIHASKKSITATGAAADHNNGPVPFSNDKELARWRDGEKAIPLKKRRMSFERTSATNSDDEVKDHEHEHEHDHDHDHDHSQEMKGRIAGEIGISENNTSKNNNVASAKKGSKRGNTIMEGSRCSRVNGRGWRCCQPTLVGYSLCEHHLGKGRLRSMTSVRGRPSLSKKAIGTTGVKVSEAANNKESEIVESEKKEAVTMKASSIGKRMKLGVVKARSLSSLLGQTSSNNSLNIAVAAMVDLQKSNNLDDQ